MEKATRLILFNIFIIITISSDPRLGQTNAITITATRSTQLGNQCTNTNRNSLYAKYGGDATIKYAEDFSQFFSLDDSVFQSFLNLDFYGINSELKSNNALGYATYIAPALIGPALLILIAPMLFICLCCPSNCCLRKKLQYSRCEKTWPVLFTMICGAITIACCFVGLLSNFKLDYGYKELSCSGIIPVDDALYGSASLQNTTFFSGITTINAQLSALNNNLNYIYGNLTSVSSSLGSSAGNALDLINQALINVSVIPNITTGNLSLAYNTPFNSVTPNNTIQSTFPSILGSQSYPSTLTGASYLALTQAYSNLSSVTSTVDKFQSTSSSFPSALSKMINQTSSTMSSLHDSLLTVNNIIVTEYFSSNIYYIQPLYYGIILGVTIFFLLVMAIFACCDKMCCRYMLYLLGFIVFLITLLAFAVLFFLSYTSAIFYSGCNYMENTLSNPNTFVTNVQKLGISLNVAQQYSVCLSGQNGDILSQITGQQNANYLLLLKYVMTNLTAFDGSKTQQLINSSYLPLQSQVLNYANSYTTDITDPSSLAVLSFVSNANNFNCSSGGFMYDSWIPSIRQTDSVFSCKAPVGMPNSDSSTCTSLNNFMNASTGCIGCMDTFSLLSNQSTSTQAYNLLNSRYNNCTSFNNYLSNIWQNYYLVKKNILGPVASRQYTARLSVQSVVQDYATLGPTFQTTLNNLYSSSQQILTVNYGMLWGLNCKVIGQDLNLFLSSACYNTFSYSYFHRILNIIISFSLLLLLCCNTCSIFRRRKDIIDQHQQKGKQRAHAYGDPLSDARLQHNYL